MAGGTAVESSVPDNLDPVEPQIDDVFPDGAGDEEAATEARAREMGWKPLAEYRGPPGKWQPAADFIARGENILPIVRDQNRRLTERVGKLEGEISGLRLTAEEQLRVIKEMREMGQRANKAGYDRAMADIKAKTRQAVETGNTEAYDQLIAQAEALQESRPVVQTAVTEPAPVRPAEPAAPSLTPTVQAFIRENAWFNSDKLLSNTMVAMHQEVISERHVTQSDLNADPALDRELLEEAKSRVTERYPERFETDISEPRARGASTAPVRPARRAAAVSAPTAGERAPRPGAPQTTINSITDPAERAQCRDAFNRMKRQLPDYTEAEYMAVYADPHNDVLALQQKPRSQSNGR